MTTIRLPRPIFVDQSVVTLNRSDWDTLMAECEDSEDGRALAAHLSRTAEIGADAMRQDSLSGDEALRAIAGAPVLMIYRERAGMTRRALAVATGLVPGVIKDMEDRACPADPAAIAEIARALGVSIDALSV